MNATEIKKILKQAKIQMDFQTSFLNNHDTIENKKKLEEYKEFIKNDHVMTFATMNDAHKIMFNDSENEELSACHMDHILKIKTSNALLNEYEAMCSAHANINKLLKESIEESKEYYNFWLKKLLDFNGGCVEHTEENGVLKIHDFTFNNLLETNIKSDTATRLEIVTPHKYNDINAFVWTLDGLENFPNVTELIITGGDKINLFNLLNKPPNKIKILSVNENYFVGKKNV